MLSERAAIQFESVTPFLSVRISIAVQVTVGVKIEPKALNASAGVVMANTLYPLYPEWPIGSIRKEYLWTLQKNTLLERTSSALRRHYNIKLSRIINFPNIIDLAILFSYAKCRVCTLRMRTSALLSLHYVSLLIFLLMAFVNYCF